MGLVHIDVPYLPIKEYARRTGQTYVAVYQQCRDGKLPVAPREGDRSAYLVNIALLTKQALERKY